MKKYERRKASLPKAERLRVLRHRQAKAKMKFERAPGRGLDPAPLLAGLREIEAELAKVEKSS